MCAIGGWHSKIRPEVKKALLENGTNRGRDGGGILIGDREFRWVGKIPTKVVEMAVRAERVIFNFRATPTTETESDPAIMQPYGGIVHNGVIANDKEFGNFAVDSMVLPKLLGSSFRDVFDGLKLIKGSYALAKLNPMDLILATNYKPIYDVLVGRHEDTMKGYFFASEPEMFGHALWAFERPVPIKPYTVKQVFFIGSTFTFQEVNIKRSWNQKALVSCSGGLDSTTVAYKMKANGYDVSLVHFTYGCKAEAQELKRIKAIANHGGFELVVLDLPRVSAGTIVNGTAHDNGVEAAEYAEDWVSARNLLMLSTMTAYAEANDFHTLAFGGNLEESGAYPDNEFEFGRKFQELLPYAVNNGFKMEVVMPVGKMMKHEIVKLGNKVGVPWELTWSCYHDGDEHCGKCGPCFMRKTAFERNGLTDPVMP